MSLQDSYCLVYTSKVFGDWKQGFPSVREHLSKGSEKKDDPTLDLNILKRSGIK